MLDVAIDLAPVDRNVVAANSVLHTALLQGLPTARQGLPAPTWL